MSRDPRNEPKAGDVLTNGKQTYYVTSVESGHVFYTIDRPPVPEESICIEDWQAYAQLDQVVEIEGKPA